MQPDVLDRTTARTAIALANRAPSVHNSQPWRWRIGASSIHLFADPARALPATDPDARDLRISCGAALHHLGVALRASGLTATVHRFPDPAHSRHLAAVETASRQPTVQDLALAQTIEARRSDRRVFSSWPVPAEFLSQLADLAAGQGAALTVLERESHRRGVALLVEQAAIEQALTPGLVQETATWTGRGRSADEGVPARNVPTLPDGTVPVRHFAGRGMAQSALGRDESDGTVLAILSTSSDSAVDQLRTGEALSAVLLRATQIGLATDPISQPLEVVGTRAELRSLCLAGQSEPQLLLRLGWPQMGVEPVPPTGRRPVKETIDGIDDPWE